MTRPAIAVIALAGIAPAALAQRTNLNIRADQGDGGAYAIGETITWTVSVTGITNLDYLQLYDLNFIASDPTAGNSSGFDDNLLALISPLPGTPSGASIYGTWGGQSSLLDPLGVVTGDVVIGTFTTVVTATALLSFDVTDADNSTYNQLRIYTSGFGGPYEDQPNVHSDTVYLGGAIPAPITLAPLALGGLTLTRRRR